MAVHELDVGSVERMHADELHEAFTRAVEDGEPTWLVMGGVRGAVIIAAEHYRKLPEPEPRTGLVWEAPDGT